jgi:hypothetical protein
MAGFYRAGSIDRVDRLARITGDLDERALPELNRRCVIIIST